MQLIKAVDGALGVIPLYSSHLIASLPEIQCSAAKYICWAESFVHTGLTPVSARSQGLSGTVVWDLYFISSQGGMDLVQGETVQRGMSRP